VHEFAVWLLQELQRSRWCLLSVRVVVDLSCLHPTLLCTLLLQTPMTKTTVIVKILGYGQVAIHIK
jgi:hypothetical protein